MKVSLKLVGRNWKAKAKYFGPDVSAFMPSSSISCLLTPLPQTRNVFPGHLQLPLLGPALVVESLSMEVFKIRLDVVLGNLLWLPLLEQRDWTRQSPEVPADINRSVMNPVNTKLMFKPRPRSERLSVNLMVKEEIVKQLFCFETYKDIILI